MNDINDLIDTLYSTGSKDLEAVVKKIHANPELSGKETLACAFQAGLLERCGFSVTTGFKGLDTAYAASLGTGAPHVCFMAEYDALPGIGHGCGHHLIAGVALGAGIVLKDLMIKNRLKGRVTVMGTPAEEEWGGKIDLIRKGALKDVDVVLMAHPAEHPTSQSMEESGIIQIMAQFHGRIAHAAAGPEKGLNALDAVRLLFSGVDAWRQQLPETSRVHGIIRDGGEAPNIIPDFTRAEFYLRDFDLAVMAAMKKRFENMVKGAALMTDTRGEVEEIPNPYKPGKPNGVLNRMFMDEAQKLGMAPQWRERSRASSDFGDVTYEVPAMQCYFNITGEKTGITLHSREFAACAVTPFAFSQMGKTARILARIGHRFMTDTAFRRDVLKAFPFNGG